MDISVNLKEATTLAKSKNYDQAIELLIELLPIMASQGGFPHSAYTKIIPYFQKAGRYSEVEEFCKTYLFISIKRDCDKTFAHKPKETGSAFIHLHTTMVYDKLLLCAKREKCQDDMARFQNAKVAHYDIYESWFLKEHGYT
ncbi:hypothetical protein [Moritella dasanensis]|uniref:hypothetical protein n=1 Tax=Moritella dasanensis TaxID=428031 RepID=UPI0003734759|nr:hypothetical protein [Moritella dasanensis]